jgi:hypothetical protein
MASVWEQVASLSAGLLMRWSICGHKYDAATAANLATLLQENGFTNMVQLDYINWTIETSMMYGFSRGDVQRLLHAQLQGGTLRETLLHDVAAQRTPTVTLVRKSVITGMINFDLARWCAAQPRVDDLFPAKANFIIGRQVLRLPRRRRRLVLRMIILLIS